MRVGEIIRAKKSDIQIGAWSSGHIPPSKFSLRAKPSSFKLGPSWAWAVVRFSALNQQFRVLCLLNEGKDIFRAILAIDVGGELKQICVHEFHASEPGWHCHVALNAQDVPNGWSRKGMRRHPHGARILDTFGQTQLNAVRTAARVYRIEAHGPLL